MLLDRTWQRQGFGEPCTDPGAGIEPERLREDARAALGGDALEQLSAGGEALGDGRVGFVGQQFDRGAREPVRLQPPLKAPETELSLGTGCLSNVLPVMSRFMAGKAVPAAVDAGFSKALLTIIDTHVTTVVSCAFLFIFGTTAVKGFAVTLVIGLLANLFTAVFVSKTIRRITRLYVPRLWHPQRLVGALPDVSPVLSCESIFQSDDVARDNR